MMINEIIIDRKMIESIIENKKDKYKNSRGVIDVI